MPQPLAWERRADPQGRAALTHSGHGGAKCYSGKCYRGHGRRAVTCAIDAAAIAARRREFWRAARERKRGVMHQSNKVRSIGRLSCLGRGLVAAGVAMALMSWVMPASAQTYESYGVFCANGRIEIDARSEEQMRSNRGACQFG